MSQIKSLHVMAAEIVHQQQNLFVLDSELPISVLYSNHGILLHSSIVEVSASYTIMQNVCCEAGPRIRRSLIRLLHAPLAF